VAVNCFQSGYKFVVSLVLQNWMSAFDLFIVFFFFFADISCWSELKLKKKSNLHYTRLIPFRVSRVDGAHLRGFAPRPTQSRLQRWRVVGNVCAPEANVLPFVLSGRFRIEIQLPNQERNQDFAKGGAWKWKHFCDVILMTHLDDFELSELIFKTILLKSRNSQITEKKRSKLSDILSFFLNFDFG